jgi:hypothetical protein
MSGHSTYHDRSRYDSALDLSHNGGHIPHEDFEDTQTVAASSVMGPWSQYNTRVYTVNHLLCSRQLTQTQFESDRVSSYAPSCYPLRPHAFNTQNPIESPTPVFNDNFSPDEPFLRQSSPHAAAFFSSSSATSLPFAAASHPTASPTLPTHIPTQKDTTICAQCGQHFTGAYRAGNLGRHTRQKHASTDRSLYDCTGCSKVFQRQDARLKHARRRHPELFLPPVQRRQSTEQYSMTSSIDDTVHIAHDLDYNVGQWSQPNNILADNHVHEPEDEGTSVAQYVVTAVEASLHPTDYLRGCDSFFTRWESIVQQLLEKRSDAYPVYSQVLEDIRAIMHANNIAHTTCSSSHRPTRRANTEQRAVPRDNGNSALGYEPNRIDKRGERKLSTPGSGKNTMVALGAKSIPGRRTEVDCPVFKHHIMHNTAPPCRGCRVGVMAQVRSHLNPSRTGIHRGFPAFVQQCSRCKQDFVERHLYEDHLSASACISQNQTRGDIAIPWARQYLALYPNAPRVPLPWPNERGWLPNSVFMQCRAPVTDSTVARPFLGEHRSRHDPQPQIPARTMDNLTEDPEYRAALGHMLHDFVAPTYSQITRSSTPVFNHDRPTATVLGSPFNGTVSNHNQPWLSVLQSFGEHQRTIRQAAAYLTPPQLQYMAAESDRISNISRGMYQHHHQPQAQMQPAPTQTSPTATYDGSSTQGSTAAYGTPFEPQHSQTFNYVQFTPSNPGSIDELVSPSTNTLPSNVSYGARSSLRPNSMLTDPSSAHVPSNHGLLSPHSPYGYRRTSLPPEVFEDGPRSRQVFPGPRSLPNNPGDNIDPLLLSDDNAEYDGWIHYDDNDL